MTAWAYYNENDPNAAAWLRELIKDGHIAPGVVDGRSIEDVAPDELFDFDQCHFFAGIGAWSYALRSAGWPDGRPVWTASLPCQPFSAAGGRAGFADERHLWPHFYHLIREHQQWCRQQKRPTPIILGEQVASKDADTWIDLVHTDLEALGHAFAAIPFPSASVGAPHIRDRNYWLAYPDSSAGGKGRAHIRRGASGGDAQPWSGLGGSRMSRGMGNTDHARLEGYAGHGGAAGRQGQERPASATGVSVRLADNDSNGFAPGASSGLRNAEHHAEPCGDHVGLANSNGRDASAERQQHGGQQRLHAQDDGAVRGGGGGREHHFGAELGAGPTNGRWREADWLFCRDAKWRPVEAGTFPLADGLPRGVGSGGAGVERLAGLAGLDNASLTRAKSYRVGALRGYGNAINPEQASEFIKIVMEAA